MIHARLLSALLLLAALPQSIPAAPAPGTKAPEELRVCADPNNLPFSNDRRQGFENRIADLLARDLGLRVRYTWWAQRRGFFRSTLKAGLCDVVMGVPKDTEMALTTIPYYRSTYVWVSRRAAGAAAAPFGSFDDPRLARLKVGVQMVGDDYANTPPAFALTRRGLVSNVVGFTLYGDYARPNPPARIVEAVAAGKVDVAVVWGPLAGWLAKRQGLPIRLDPVEPPADMPEIPFSYDIAVGVRRGDRERKARLDVALLRRRAEIVRILEAYGVPRVAPAPAPSPAAAAAMPAVARSVPGSAR